MEIHYYSSRRITAPEFIDLLNRSTLGERRPVHDSACIEAMLLHANLLCTAWEGDKLVGVARGLTDFAYCCYLSDLAVDEAYQRRGIGRRLIELCQSRLGDQAKLILLSAPKAEEYYPKLGLDAHRSAWTIPSRRPLR